MTARWRYSDGDRGNIASVYEREPGGILYGRIWDRTKRGGKGDWVKKSLGHKDKKRAKQWVRDQVNKLERGQESLRTGKLQLGLILDSYLELKSPEKDPKTQAADRRKAELYKRRFGSDRDPYTILHTDLEAFARDRGSGEIDADGRWVSPDERRPVGPRTVEVDLVWLKAVFNWATERQLPGQGKFLMRENPVRGFKIPREQNPRRPLATMDRYERTRAVSDEVMMTVGRGRGRTTRRSHLSELLDVTVGTGRRIGAVRQLRFEDLLLERDPDAYPYGRIHWPSDTDKGGQEWVVPMNALTRSAIDRILVRFMETGRREGYLFPSPRDPEKAVGYRLTVAWLAEAEAKAGLEPLEGGKWHPYRRMWATSRKGHPVQDVARAGGWKTTAVVENIYQQADDETTLKVVLDETHVVGRKTG